MKLWIRAAILILCSWHDEQINKQAITLPRATLTSQHFSTYSKTLLFRTSSYISNNDHRQKPGHKCKPVQTAFLNQSKLLIWQSYLVELVSVRYTLWLYTFSLFEADWWIINRCIVVECLQIRDEDYAHACQSRLGVV